MTVQELIDELMTIEDKSIKVLVPDVCYSINGFFIELDNIDDIEEDIIQLY